MGIAVGEVLFVDTNVLLTGTDESREHHRAAQRLLGAGNRGGLHLGVSGQILREYLVVATRPPEVNGLGLSTSDALANIEAFARRVLFFQETEAVSERLRQLARRHGLTGKRIHDANVVATMLVHGITRLVTQNPGDFSGFPEVVTVSPVDLDGAISSAETES